jgi:hypothetical protein
MEADLLFVIKTGPSPIPDNAFEFYRIMAGAVAVYTKILTLQMLEN